MSNLLAVVIDYDLFPRIDTQNTSIPVCIANLVVVAIKINRAISPDSGALLLEWEYRKINGKRSEMFSLV